MNTTFEAVGLTGMYGVGIRVLAPSAERVPNCVPTGSSARRIRSAATTIVHPSPSTVV